MWLELVDMDGATVLVNMALVQKVTADSPESEVKLHFGNQDRQYINMTINDLNNQISVEQRRLAQIALNPERATF